MADYFTPEEPEEFVQPRYALRQDKSEPGFGMHVVPRVPSFSRDTIRALNGGKKIHSLDMGLSAADLLEEGVKRGYISPDSPIAYISKSPRGGLTRKKIH